MTTPTTGAPTPIGGRLEGWTRADGDPVSPSWLPRRSPTP